MTPSGHRTQLLILSGPSGVGKTTLANALMERHPHRFQRIITVTTRPMRSGDVDGIDYHFVNESEFDSMVQQGQFLEHATVYGHRYGTVRQSVEECLRYRNGIWILDVQGFRAIARKWRQRMVSVFVMPPKLEDLTMRLNQRDPHLGQVNAIRLAAFESEREVAKEYDAILVNDDLDQACRKMESLMTFLQVTP